jgi:S1-C subfamily serine protease
VAKLQPSTVMIIADFPETAISCENVGFGTGFVYTDDGYIVTNAHVVEGAAAITVVPPGSNRERPARFVGVSTCDDLAVIKVDDMEGLAPAAFGRSDELKVGEEVMALGYPFGAEIGTDLSVTRGIVSKLDVQLPPY